MNWMYFPKNQKITDSLKELTDIFELNKDKISSASNTFESNDVLNIMTQSLLNIGYQVELGKKKADKIRMPVTYGENGKIELSFEVDGYLPSEGIVVEIEAGRAVENYQFLKDLFEACCMTDAKYLCIAVREVYRKKKDYQKVCKFFEALYASDRFAIPLQGVLIIGY